jgi:SAM-dependent methyltransferase
MRASASDRRAIKTAMRGNLLRPFYTEYAWAFDLLIDRPVRKDSATIVAWLIERGVRPGADVLDAGCGTGRYALELARRGYIVNGIDISPELVDEARRSLGSARNVSFAVGDILALPAARYDAILCRGVLNDFLDDEDRQTVFASFCRALRSAGVVILDVREWSATAERKLREPVFRKSVATDRGKLTFTSVTELDAENRRLVVSERHALSGDGEDRSSDYVFVMRCWTRDELDSNLRAGGFGRIAYFGAYDPTIGPGSTDRLVALAQRTRAVA